MKKLFYTITSIIVISSLAISACTASGFGDTDDLLDAIRQDGYIVISTDADYEPQSWLYSEGERLADTRCPPETLTNSEMRGFDVDVAVAIGDGLGVETCFTTPSWEKVVAGSWNDNWDISVGSMTITTERQQLFEFSIPYYYAPAVVAVRTDLNFDSLDDLAGRALCVGESTTYEAWLNREDMGGTVTVLSPAPGNITVITLDTDQRCPQSLADGRNDYIGYVTTSVVVDSNIAEGLPVVKLGGPVFLEHLAIAYDRASTLPSDNLRAEVDRLIMDMRSNGALSELSDKWFGMDLTQLPN